VMDVQEQPAGDAGPWAKLRERKKNVGRKAARYSIVWALGSPLFSCLGRQYRDIMAGLPRLKEK
jgi:hypothetical protein